MSSYLKLCIDGNVDHRMINLLFAADILLFTEINFIILFIASKIKISMRLTYCLHLFFHADVSLILLFFLFADFL